jgi:hypothetical protein
MTLTVFMIFASGCTQQVPVPVPAQPGETDDPAFVTGISPVPGAAHTTGKMVTATATKLDPAKIVITYNGGRDADQLMELETTVTDSNGTTRTQSMGSRLGTTPAQSGGTDTFYGPYTGKAHVLTIGYFSDGTHQDILDTWIWCESSGKPFSGVKSFISGSFHNSYLSFLHIPDTCSFHDPVIVFGSSPVRQFLSLDRGLYGNPSLLFGCFRIIILPSTGNNCPGHRCFNSVSNAGSDSPDRHLPGTLWMPVPGWSGCEMGRGGIFPVQWTPLRNYLRQ